MSGPFGDTDVCGLHPIFAEATFVGPTAARMLGCMRSFDNDVEEALGCGVHTVWVDPREGGGSGSQVPLDYDKALLVARIASGVSPRPFACVQKSEAVHFPEATGCADLVDFCWTLQVPLDQSFRVPAGNMWAKPAVESDAGWSGAEVRGWQVSTQNSSASACFPGRAQAWLHRTQTPRLRRKVHFRDDPIQGHINRWISQVEHCKPPTLSQLEPPCASTALSSLSSTLCKQDGPAAHRVSPFTAVLQLPEGTFPCHALSHQLQPCVASAEKSGPSAALPARGPLR